MKRTYKVSDLSIYMVDIFGYIVSVTDQPTPGKFDASGKNPL